MAVRALCEQGLGGAGVWLLVQLVLGARGVTVWRARLRQGWRCGMATVVTWVLDGGCVWFGPRGWLRRIVVEPLTKSSAMDSTRGIRLICSGSLRGLRFQAG